MKKIYTLLVAVLISAGMLLPSIAIAQSPQKMTYQSIIRNSSDILLTNQSLGMQISILQGSASGTAVYVEIQNPTSNINGLVSLEIGTGTVLSGSFAAIDWANGPYYIKTEIDPNGGASYTIAGTSQMLSVPFALYGEDADADPNNELQTLSFNTSSRDLSITGGNTVAIPAAPGDNWGTQTVASNSTLTGNGTTASPLVVNGDLTDDQTLSVSGGNLTIQGGNTVALPSAASCWNASGSNIYNNNTGNVGLGVTSPSFLFDIQSSSNAYLNIKATSTGTSYGGLILNRPNTNSKMRIFFSTASSNKWLFGQIGTNENLSISRNTITDDGTFHINQSNGYIGIGTTTPYADLHLDGGNFRLNDVNNGPDIDFYTNGTTRMASIQSNSYGDFGLYTYDDRDLNINSDKNIEVVADSIIELKTGTGYTGTIALRINKDQKIGIRTTIPTTDLTVKLSSTNPATAGITLDYYLTGSYSPWTIYRTNLFLRFAYNNTCVAYVSSNGTWTTSSDRRLKENITNMESVLDRVNQLEAVRYNFIDRDNSNTIGFIAQDVLPLFPEVVGEPDDDNTHYGIAYGQMSIIAIKAIQEQQKIIDDLQKQIDELRELMNNE